MITTCLIGLDTATSDAPAGGVRPLELHHVCAKLLRLPRADVADLSVLVVVVTLAWNRVRDRFAQLVRAGRGERVEQRESPCAAAAVRVGHHRIEDRAVDVTVIAAEARARKAVVEAHRDARWQKDEVEAFGIRLRHLAPDESLYVGVADRRTGRAVGDRRGAGASAVADGHSLGAVLG